MRHLVLIVLTLAFVSSALAQPQRQIVEISPSDLKITSGQWPDDEAAFDSRFRERWSLMQPRIAVPDEVEAYYVDASDRPRGAFGLAPPRSIILAASKLEGLTATLYVPKPDWSGMAAIEFDVAGSNPQPVDEEALDRARRQHFQRLLDRDFAGAAWFRHRLNEVQRRLGEQPRVDPQIQAWQAREEAARLYAVFTGGRAVAENLQLDRALQTLEDQAEPTVPLEGIEGITVREIDWSEHIAGKAPQADPLAKLIPADQHALLFSSYSSMLRLMDEAEKHGTPVLRAMEPRSEDAMTRERYQKQLCLEVTAISRLLGPEVIDSVAITGSDPYLRAGTDLAVLFESSHVELLRQHLVGQQDAAAAEHGVEVSGPTLAGVRCRAVQTTDRRISSYMAVLGSTVVVANSPVQLQRVIETHAGTRQALASLDEYTFFRDRYRRGDPAETGLLIVTDATIRRWCGPRWRIASARRTLAQAKMMRIEMEHLQSLASGSTPPVEQRGEPSLLGSWELTSDGVRSSRYNRVEFLTPIAELEFEMVRESEREAYERWREQYQRRWRQNFDPIAMRFTVDDERLAADVTVMPLIEGSDYAEVIELARGAKIGEEAGDRHEQAILHFAMAIDRDSRPVRQLSGFATGAGIRVDPLSWLGETIAVYVDRDPFWVEAAEAEDPNQFVEENLHRLPVAFYAESRSGLALAGFLTSLRGLVETSAPGMVQWGTRSYRDQSYVRISENEAARATPWREMAIHYLVRPDSLTVSLNEDVVKRAIDRQLAGKEAVGRPAEPDESGSVEAEDTSAEQGADVSQPMPWLGDHIALQARPQAISLLNAAGQEPYTHLMQARSWSSLPILNALREALPNRDPQQVYLDYWGARLVCPGGGEYIWDPQWQTYQSTAYGHPGEPKPGPGLPAALQRIEAGNFGVTFEADGLRARAILHRGSAPQ